MTPPRSQDRGALVLQVPPMQTTWRSSTWRHRSDSRCPSAHAGGPSLCPAGTYYVAGYTIQVADSYRVNGILNYPSVLDVLLQHQQPSIFARMVGYSTLNTGALGACNQPWQGGLL